MTEQTTYNQHYVWRYYLRPWCHCVKGKKDSFFIWWNNKKKHAFTNVVSILRGKNFYQLKPLNAIEFYLLENMFAKTKQGLANRENEAILRIASTVSLVDKVVGNNSEFTDSQIQSGEFIQSETEKLGIEGISHLLKEDIKWLDNDSNRAAFLIFLCTQYFRTKMMKEKAIKAMDNESERLIETYKSEFNDATCYTINWEKIYNYGHLCYANTLSASLFSKNIRFELVKSRIANFIVSDQPVYNLGDHTIGEFILFYPLSPKLAVIGSIDFDKNRLVEIDDNKVLYYNHNTLKHVNDFFMGKDERDVNFDFHS